MDKYDYIFAAVIYNVVDGDTVDAELDLGFKLKLKQRLRLSGIDTPERGQPGYNEAKTALIESVMTKRVSIITHKPSKFGYYLADIFVDGININEKMLTEGFAKSYHGEKKTTT